MASLTIVTREAKDGPRYLVRFRLGGRAYPWVHAGSFRTQKGGEGSDATSSAARSRPGGTRPSAHASCGPRDAQASRSTRGRAVPRLPHRRRPEHGKNYGAHLRRSGRRSATVTRSRSRRPRSRSGSPRSPRSASQGRSAST